MSVQTAVSMLLAALVLIPGVLSQNWGVWYNPGNICALQGSTVVMGCNYSYPSGNSVTQTFWMDKDYSNNPTDLSTLPQYVNRTEYLGNKEKNCTLRLRNLTTSDSKTYLFRFITNTTVGKWTGKPGVSLSVTGLQAQVNSSTVTEGQAVNLTCKTSCTLSDPTFTWYRNGLLLPAQTPSSPLTFNPVSYEHDGSYSCTARGYDNLPSPAVTLSVRYAPKNTSVSISPSGEIAEGGSVTLTCSSSANPPVKNYTWFKLSGTGPLYKGSNYTIINISSADSGQYYCEARNQIGALNSTAETLTVKRSQQNVVAWWVTAAVVAIVLVVVMVMVVVMVVVLLSRKKTLRSKREDESIDMDQQDKINTVYANVTPAQGHAPPAEEGDKEDKGNPDDDEVHYATFNFPAGATASSSERTPAETEGDSSVIYSSVGKPGERRP
ncbi:B-cell receptor CD22-like isoform X2 [Lepisosteus oculatus]|uniref:B-cell receptor CD22-like isoform X2 n=1 Tax=Lepisosteus oculatus TaxID=7918 RepID=UPI0007401050|nr:PREDICTED: B-cell receptor CD22-like isoform X2 [Lepisosteus oculatus]